VAFNLKKTWTDPGNASRLRRRALFLVSLGRALFVRPDAFGEAPFYSLIKNRRSDHAGGPRRIEAPPPRPAAVGHYKQTLNKNQPTNTHTINGDVGGGILVEKSSSQSTQAGGFARAPPPPPPPPPFVFGFFGPRQAPRCLETVGAGLRKRGHPTRS